jgi:hypothetical protein
MEAIDADSWTALRSQLVSGEELLWAGRRHLPGTIAIVGMLFGAGSFLIFRHPDALSAYGISRDVLFRSYGHGSLVGVLMFGSIAMVVGAFTSRLWVFGLTDRRLIIIAPAWLWSFLPPLNRQGAWDAPTNGVYSLFLVRSGPVRLYKHSVQIGPVSAWVDDRETLCALAEAARQKAVDAEEQAAIESYKR